MIKTAIFVEGHTELIFVREYLLKMFDYQNIALECYTLFTDSKFIPTEYEYPNENAVYFFLLINVGNDNAVLTRILHREKYLWAQGYDKIIGLRDMYSKAYREVNPTVGVINPEINTEFKRCIQKEILLRASKPEQIIFLYAIMEVESWILALKNSFEKLSPQLTAENIKDNLGIDLNEIDPETTFYHPAKEIERIFELIGMNYNKSKGDIYALMSIVAKENFIELFESPKCQSFKDFHSNFTFL